MRNRIRKQTAAALLAAALAGVACGGGRPPADEPPGAGDLEYLVWEVCRQVRGPNATPDRVSGILQDAARHGPVMDAIEAECGQEIAAAFSE